MASNDNVYSFMSFTSVYDTTKKDKSVKAVQHGFYKTVVHALVLLIAIIVMSVHYAQTTVTVRHDVTVDKTESDWIPFVTYSSLVEENEFESIISCSCAQTKTNWAQITDDVVVHRDYVCDDMYIAYDACYYDATCRDGFVGQVLFWYFAALCDAAELLYPFSEPQTSLTATNVLTQEELDLLAVELGLCIYAHIHVSFTNLYTYTQLIAWQAMLPEVSEQLFIQHIHS